MLKGFLGVGAFLALAFAFAALFNKRNEDQHEFGRQSRPGPNTSRETRLGPCSFCHKEVNTFNGFLVPCCNHVIHYTCIDTLKKELRSANPKMLCTILTTENGLANGLSGGSRNRSHNESDCAVCMKPLKSTKVTILPCRHQVHKSCWARAEETSTTCPACMEM